MVRKSIKYVPWKDNKLVTADLKQIYQSATEEEALLALDRFSDRWDDKYPQISRSWRTHWHNLMRMWCVSDWANCILIHRSRWTIVMSSRCWSLFC